MKPWKRLETWSDDSVRRLDRAFVLLVFDVTNNGWLHRSYNELVEMLHVSHSTVRRCVKRCVEAGLIVAHEERYRTGGQRDNAYSIDWEGVRAYCFNNTLTEGPAVQGEQPPVQNDHPPVHPDQPPVQNDHPYKEYKNTLNPTKEPPPPSEKPVGGGGSFEQWIASGLVGVTKDGKTWFAEPEPAEQPTKMPQVPLDLLFDLKNLINKYDVDTVTQGLGTLLYLRNDH